MLRNQAKTVASQILDVLNEVLSLNAQEFTTMSQNPNKAGPQ